ESLASDTGDTSSDKITKNDRPEERREGGRGGTLTEGTATLGTATADGGGVWSFTPSLADGVHTIVARETDVAGNTGSTSLTVTLATAAPSVSESLASDTGDTSSDKITKNDALSGTAEAGRVVTLTEGTATLGTPTANPVGVWSFTPSLAD